MIADSLVSAVRDAARCEDIAGDHTRLKPASGRLFGVCPLHKEKTASFSVDPKTGLFYCFGCGKGGDALGLHMLVTGDDFREAVEALARRYGIHIPESGRDEHADLRAAVSAAQDFFRRSLPGSEGEAYLERRGIPPAARERYGIGYAPRGWRPLQEHLAGRFPVAALIACGLAVDSGAGKPYDRFRNRITFPIRDAAGRACGFSGRAVGDEQPKYMNSPEGPIFRKGSLLFGLAEAKAQARAAGVAVLCEGQPDVIAADAAGWAAVASLGTALTAEQIALLGRACRRVVLAFDPDAAGEGAARKALAPLLRAGLEVARAELPGCDLDGLRARGGDVGALLSAAPDALLREAEAPTTGPRGRADLARHLHELLGCMRDDFLRAEYAAEIQRRTGLAVSAPSPAPAVEPGPVAASAIVRPLEALALDLLLAEGAELPDPEELPPAAAFSAPWGEVYDAFLRLYAVRCEQPQLAAVLRALPPASAAAGALASLRPEEARGSLRGTISALYRRYARAALSSASAAEREHLSKILAKRY